MANEYRITHALAEVLRKGDPNTRITHALAEVIRKGDPDVTITHALAEVIRKGDPDVTITHALVEVLRSNTTQVIKLDKLSLLTSVKDITVELIEPITVTLDKLSLIASVKDITVSLSGDTDTARKGDFFLVMGKKGELWSGF